MVNLRDVCEQGDLNEDKNWRECTHSANGPWLGRFRRMADWGQAARAAFRGCQLRQEFVGAFGGVIRQAGQHVDEPSLRIDIGELGAGDAPGTTPPLLKRRKAD
jgi:hypothetical protein